MIFRSNDLAAFFGVFGVSVQFKGSSANGLLDQPVQIRLADKGFGGIDADLPVIKLPYNAFSPMPGTRDTLTVDGNDYTVAERTVEGDGAVISYALKAAA